ncbi:hypothetical protein GSI_05044 [Ganoderma sinense ZZ0214-1]|uniref:MFS general substrate transporter n=1 Tax=Ganoderma sinense ZZ0214-1 TaxID=1077348 RepID=A0A2G8SGN4_9APHY|nr:hypothetical protein GSI_05044 [Ganoderma sinense ZZ0214-1]
MFVRLTATLAEINRNPPREETEESSGNKYSEMFKLKSLHLMAVFILVYIGVEVTLGGAHTRVFVGWIVTYVIDLRGGSASAGYISSGFFADLTLGRIGFLWIGEHRVIFLYGIVATGLELVVWLIPSLIGDGIAVSFVDVLLGPIYLIVMNHAGRILPPSLLTGSIGWMAGFGQVGSAVLPFITGAIASKTGIKGLQPLYVPVGVADELHGLFDYISDYRRG